MDHSLCCGVSQLLSTATCSYYNNKQYAKVMNKYKEMYLNVEKEYVIQKIN